MDDTFNAVAFRFIDGRFERWPAAERLGCPDVMLDVPHRPSVRFIDPVTHGADAVRGATFQPRTWKARLWRVPEWVTRTVAVYVEEGAADPTDEQVVEAIASRSP